MQVIAEPGEKRNFHPWPGQEVSVGRQRIQRTEEAQTVNEIADEGIDRDHAFSFEFAQRHMNRPLVWTGGAKAVIRQVDTLADAHAGVAEQEEDISAQIVAAHELLLEELILLCAKRTGQTLRCTRDILAPYEVSEFSELVCPGQLIANGAQSDQPCDAGCRRQGRSLCTQARHPSEDVRVASQQLETRNLRVFGAEIDKEVARHNVVLPLAARRKCSA